MTSHNPMARFLFSFLFHLQHIYTHFQLQTKNSLTTQVYSSVVTMKTIICFNVLEEEQHMENASHVF